MIFKINLDGKISLLYPKQVPESHIPGANVSALVVLVFKVGTYEPMNKQTKMQQKQDFEVDDSSIKLKLIVY